MLDGHWRDADEAYGTMCHPPPDQLPAGIDDDLLGRPRWGETQYERHYKDFLPTGPIRDRASSAISWFAANGYPGEEQEPHEIYDRIWSWDDAPAGFPAAVFP